MSWIQGITENLGIKLIALVLAVLLYAHVVTDRQDEQVLRFPVQITGLGDTLALASDPPNELGVRVRGTGKQLIRLSVLRPPVAIDLSGVGPGNYQRSLTTADFKTVSDENVEVLAAVEPAQVQLAIEPRVMESVSVSVRLTGDPAPGFLIAGEPRIQPTEVRLSGPSTWVLEHEGIETLPLDITDRREPLEQIIGLASIPGWARSQPGSVLVTIPIEEEAGGTVRVEPSIEGLRGANFTARVDPAEVVVEWTAPASRAENALADLQIMVNVERRGRGRYVLPVTIAGTAAEFVRAVEPDSVAVTLH